jgi:protein N-terminal methyltransferase
MMFKTKPSPERRRAVDCGAGIGRISKYLLMDFFEKVDLVEQDENFVKKAEESLKDTGKLGRIFNVGLQDFQPEEKYDVIWIQWVLGYLKDPDLVELLRRCSNALNKNGMIIIKENFTKTGEVELDEADSSVTRSLKLMKKIIKEADLRIVKEAKQTHFPKGLYPVHMLACRKSLS